MNTIKAILIDPFTKSIKEVEVERDLQAIYKALDCSTFEVLHLPDQDALYIDEEALLTNRQGREDADGFHLYGFLIEGINSDRPIIGRGLIMGTDEDGVAVDVVVNIEEVDAAVLWWNKKV